MPSGKLRLKIKSSQHLRFIHLAKSLQDLINIICGKNIVKDIDGNVPTFA